MVTATPYRRHKRSCKYKSQKNRCRCIIWVCGQRNGAEFRYTLRTREWDVAAEKVLKILADDEAGKKPVRDEITVAFASERFQADAEARALAAGTRKKYRVLCDQLIEWAEKAGVAHVRDLDLDALQRFRASWKDSPISAAKKLERLRSFCGFCVDHEWMAKNWAKRIRRPRVDDAPTLPFTQDEVVRLLAACDTLGATDPLVRERMRVLLLVLRYTGLRIGDAVRLHESQTKGGTLFLGMQKTKVPVTFPLPEFLVAKLDAVKGAGGFYFSTGRSKVSTDAGNWRRRLRRLAKGARVENAHPHRFRDTFAVGLLQANVSIYDVSLLLGHASVKVTERSYAPWVEERRLRLNGIVRAYLDGPGSFPQEKV